MATELTEQERQLLSKWRTSLEETCPADVGYYTHKTSAVILNMIRWLHEMGEEGVVIGGEIHKIN